jgi:hypothetical protein
VKRKGISVTAPGIAGHGHSRRHLRIAAAAAAAVRLRVRVPVRGQVAPRVRLLQATNALKFPLYFRLFIIMIKPKTK